MRKDSWDLMKLGVSDLRAEWCLIAVLLRSLDTTHQSPHRLLLKKTHSPFLRGKAWAGHGLGPGREQPRISVENSYGRLRGLIVRQAKRQSGIAFKDSSAQPFCDYPRSIGASSHKRF